VSLICSMLIEAQAQSFLRSPPVADPSEAPMNRWSPYFLSILRINTAFLYRVHGTQKLFEFVSVILLR